MSLFKSKLARIGGSQMEQDYKLVENEGLFQEYLEMGQFFLYPYLVILKLLFTIEVDGSIKTFPTIQYSRVNRQNICWAKRISI